jgi:hypothetical protein
MSDAGQAVGPVVKGSGLSQDERAELERLRAQGSGSQTGPAAAEGRHIGWRAPLAMIVIVVGCLLAPVAVVGVWAANQVSSTSRYVANVEPLVHDPAVQNALTDKLTTEITTHLNVTAYTDQAAALLTSHGLQRVGALLQTFAPSISGAVGNWSKRSPGRAAVRSALATARSFSASGRSSTSSSTTWSTAASPSPASSRPSIQR